MTDGQGNPPPTQPPGPGPHDAGHQGHPPAGHGPAPAPAPGVQPGQAPFPGGEQWSGGAQPFGGPSFGGGSSGSSASTWFALASVAAIVVSVSVKENDTNGWDDHALWAGFAIACAVALLAPVARNSVNLSETRAWQVAAGGFGGLAFYWILFVLPAISRNVSFAATLGVIAAGLAVWLAPGRPQEAGERSTW